MLSITEVKIHGIDRGPEILAIPYLLRYGVDHGHAEVLTIPTCQGGMVSTMDMVKYSPSLL